MTYDNDINIGILSIQGDVMENYTSTRMAANKVLDIVCKNGPHRKDDGDDKDRMKGCGCMDVSGREDESIGIIEVNTPEEISMMNGLIIPGGESTTIGRLCEVNGCLQAIRDQINDGVPVLAICAGMIMLSKTTEDHVIGDMDQPLLGTLDVRTERNAFGRQCASFEAEISMDAINIPKFTGVFIRAPVIKDDIGSGIEVLARLGDKIVAVKKDNIIGTSFHPELTLDTSVHEHFVDIVTEYAR